MNSITWLPKWICFEIHMHTLKVKLLLFQNVGIYTTCKFPSTIYTTCDGTYSMGKIFTSGDNFWSVNANNILNITINHIYQHTRPIFPVAGKNEKVASCCNVNPSHHSHVYPRILPQTKSRRNECMDKRKMLRLPFRPYFSITNLKDSSVQAELDDNIIICISSPYVEVRL